MKKYFLLISLYVVFFHQSGFALENHGVDFKAGISGGSLFIKETSHLVDDKELEGIAVDHSQFLYMGRVLSQMCKNICVEIALQELGLDPQKEFERFDIIPQSKGVKGEDLQKLLISNEIYIEYVEAFELDDVSKMTKRLFIIENGDKSHICIAEKGDNGMWIDTHDLSVFTKDNKVHQVVKKVQALGKPLSDLCGLYIGAGEEEEQCKSSNEALKKALIKIAQKIHSRDEFNHVTVIFVKMGLKNSQNNVIGQGESIVGFQICKGADALKLRYDYDPKKGLHINVHLGSNRGNQKIAFLFPDRAAYSKTQRPQILMDIEKELTSYYNNEKNPLAVIDHLVKNVSMYYLDSELEIYKDIYK